MRIQKNTDVSEKLRAELVSMKALLDDARTKLCFQSSSIETIRTWRLPARDIATKLYGQAEADRLFPQKGTKEQNKNFDEKETNHASGCTCPDCCPFL